MTLHALMAMLDSQQYPWNRYPINNLDEIVVLLYSKIFNSSKTPVSVPYSKMGESFFQRNHNWKWSV